MLPLRPAARTHLAALTFASQIAAPGPTFGDKENAGAAAHCGGTISSANDPRELVCVALLCRPCGTLDRHLRPLQCQNGLRYFYVDVVARQQVVFVKFVCF